MRRTPLVVANWKMNHTASEAADYAKRLRPLLAPLSRDLGHRVEVAIAPAFPALDRLGRTLEGSGVALAAQNVHEAPAGAFTGEVSLAMLEDLGCRFVLIGHSERRQLLGESDERIAAKLERILPSRVCPILCVGETGADRSAGAAREVLARQLGKPTRLLAQWIANEPRPSTDPKLVIAYEPVWAIGTGRVATPEIAQETHAEIRRLLVEGLGEAGHRVRILYGGSLKPSNARSLLEQPEIDGALVGGASLDPDDFASIVSTCCETRLEHARC